MRITIESTTKIVELVIDGKAVPARVWQGETDAGIPVHEYEEQARHARETATAREATATAREATARSSELRFLSTFSPILDKRVQTEGQLFGWMAACEAWRAAIAARRTP